MFTFLLVVAALCIASFLTAYLVLRNRDDSDEQRKLDEQRRIMKLVSTTWLVIWTAFLGGVLWIVNTTSGNWIPLATYVAALLCLGARALLSPRKPKAPKPPAPPKAPRQPKRSRDEAHPSAPSLPGDFIPGFKQQP